MDLILRENAFLGETHIVTGAAQGIGLAVAHYFPQATVDLLDIDAQALSLATENAQKLGLSERVFHGHCRRRWPLKCSTISRWYTTT